MSGFADQEIKQSSKFLKVEAGTPYVVRLLDSSAVEVMKHSTGKAPIDGKFKIPCKGQETCEFCGDGDEPAQSFSVNVFNHTLKKVQLWEYGPMIAKLLKKIAVNLEEEGKDIMDFDLKVEAEGSNMQKKYSVTLRTSSTPVPTGLVKLKIDGDIPF